MDHTMGGVGPEWEESLPMPGSSRAQSGPVDVCVTTNDAHRVVLASVLTDLAGFWKILTASHWPKQAQK